MIGPDEYHEAVDDNAFTNVMARWNLRCAADAAAADGSVAPAEIRRWRAVADALVDGFDSATGVYEQFRGYFGLEPLTTAAVGSVPVAADLLLGRDRTAKSQLIKQPDVLMLHHLVPGEVGAGTLTANLGFYEPRTVHGSSLSPAISAALLARDGRPDEALTLFRLATSLDLQDRSGTTAGGLHLATLGGIWQAVLHGFAGVAVERGVLTVDPRLPASWPQLEIRFRALGRALRLTIDRGTAAVRSDGPIAVRLAGGPVRRVEGTRELVGERGGGR